MAEIKHKHLSSTTVPGMPEAVINNHNNLKTKWSPTAQIGAGMQYEIYDYFAIRSEINFSKMCSGEFKSNNSPHKVQLNTFMRIGINAVYYL